MTNCHHQHHHCHELQTAIFAIYSSFTIFLPFFAIFLFHSFVPPHGSQRACQSQLMAISDKETTPRSQEVTRARQLCHHHHHNRPNNHFCYHYQNDDQYIHRSYHHHLQVDQHTQLERQNLKVGSDR